MPAKSKSREPLPRMRRKSDYVPTSCTRSAERLMGAPWTTGCKRK
jgi:hypothetical protein